MVVASQVTRPEDPDEFTTHDIGQNLGVYKLLQVLGQGGMGRVYLAEHTLLGRKVAIKVLRSEFAQDPFIVKRFFAEARTVNQISHENIVEITDFVDGEDGTSFIVMEYLEGRSLGELLQEGPLGIARAVRIARQVASALAAVHEVGIVHRDLKPDNIMIVSRPREADFVKLLDFGAAKLNPKVVPGSVQTQAVTLIGTPQYMSPEQATGAPIDHRSDIYALGVVLYEIITGGNPFAAADTWSIIRRQVTLEPDQPDTVISMVPPCPDLNDLIMRCLSKDADERPNSMDEVEQTLAVLARDLTPVSRSAPRPTPRARTEAARAPSNTLLRAAGVGPATARLRAAAFAVAVLGAVGFAFVFASRGAVERDPAPTPAVAPVIATPPPPPTPVAQRVLLRTDPPGAEVRRVGHPELLGETPLSVEIPTGVQTLQVSISRAGFETRTKSLSRAEPVPATVALTPTPPAKKPRATKRRVVRKRRAAPPPEATRRTQKAPVGRNGVIDPFAD